MRRAPLIFFIAGLVAVASFGASYFAGRHCCDSGKAGTEMEWLRKTFQLSESQFEKVKALQESYQPTCDQLCQRITTANEQLDRLIQSSQSVTPEVEAALKQSSAVREDCRKAMLGHIYRVAAEMSPENRDRYLKMMKPRIILPAMGHPAAMAKGTQPGHCPE